MTRGSTLLALDFDGTLAPICDDPAAVRLSRGASELLGETTRMEGVVVAITSGRDAGDLAARIKAPGAYLIGSHGLEIRAPGGAIVRDALPLDAELDIDTGDLRVERKKHAIALHSRGVASEIAEPLFARFREWARAADLDLIEGRCVVEARCRGGGKEEAVRWLARAAGATRVVYAGDDLTDFGALQFAAAHGRGVFVASPERNAPPGVTVVESFRELFRLIRDEVMV